MDPAKRAQILQGAEHVFIRDGFERANVAAIAAEAGVSKGTIYVYFRDKLDLFVAVMERKRDQILAALAAELGRDGPLDERLRRYGRMVAGQLTSEELIRAHRVLIGALEAAPELADRFAESMQKGKAVLLGALGAEIAAGRLAIEDPELACDQFFELCLAGLFRPRLMGVMPEPPEPRQIEHVVDEAVATFLARYGVRGEG